MRFVDAVQTNRMTAVQLSTTMEIHSRQKGGANCLSIEALEYRYLLSGGINGVLTLYDLETVVKHDGKSIVQALLESTSTGATRTAMISSVQWYPEDTGAFVSSSTSGLVSIYDTNRFTSVASFNFANNVVNAARISRSSIVGISIAVALQDGTVHLWDPRTRDSSHIFKGHSRASTCIDWDPSSGSHLLASAGTEGAVRVWDVRKAGGVKEAAVRSLDWRGDFTTNARVNTRKLHTSLLSSSDASSDGVLRIREGKHHYNTSLYINDVNTSSGGSVVGKAHDSAVMSLRYTSCGNYLVTSGNDQKLRLWGAHTGQLAPTNFSDKIVPVSQLPYDIGIAEFSFASSDVLIVPTGASGGGGGGGALGAGTTTQSIDGDLLLIPLHGPEGGKSVKVLRGHLDRVTAIAYRKPQQQIVSAGKDGMIFVWSPPADLHKYSSWNSGPSGENRQRKLSYRNTGGRYDYQQIIHSFGKSSADADQVSGGGGGGSSSSISSGSGAAVPLLSQAQPESLRILPRNENEIASRSTVRIVQQRGLQSTIPAAEAAPGAVLNDTSSNISSTGSSGDDWSDDDDEVGVSRNSAPRSMKRKLTAIVHRATSALNFHSSNPDDICAAAAAVAGAGIVSSEEGRSSTTAAPVVAKRQQTSNNSRSFVPPIIQQYLQDAHRTSSSQPARSANPSLIRSGASSSSSSAAAFVPSLIPAPAAPFASTATAATTITVAGGASSWREVENIFSSSTSALTASGPTARSSSSSSEGSNSWAGQVSGVSSGRFSALMASTAAPGGCVNGSNSRGVGDDVLAADRRYAQWVKQQQARAKKKKK